MPPASPEHPQSFASGRYRVRRLLGEGGMGLVYQAHDDNLDCEVVIKTPRRGLLDEPGFADRFAREIRSLVTLAHPHVVKIIDVGRQDGLPFAVMQYLEGGSLADRPMPATAASLKSWLLSVAQALDFVHQQGLLHRDVKPANILFDAHGNAYLGDFGVARVLSAADPTRDRARLTGLGLVLGTPEYLAPELIMGKPEPDGRADQYALAATVYHVLAGRPPFDGATPTAVMVRHTTEAVPPLRDLASAVTAGLAAAVEKGLSKEPGGRHPNCVAFVRAALTGNVAPTRPAPAGPKPTPSRPSIAPTRIVAAPKPEEATPPRPPVAPPTPRRPLTPVRIEAAPQVPPPSSFFRQPTIVGVNPFEEPPPGRFRQPSTPEIDTFEQPPPGLPRRVLFPIAVGVLVVLCCGTLFVVSRSGGFRRSTPVVGGETVVEKAKPIAKFRPIKAAMTLDRPVAGVPATLRVNLDFPKDVPPFPVDKLRFTLDGKESLADRQCAGGTLVTLPRPGLARIIAEYAGDDLFEKVSILLEVKVFAPIPKFMIDATPKEAMRGEKIEVSVEGLPASITQFGPIGLVGQPGDAKVTPSPDGRKPILVEGLRPGKYALWAKFAGDDSYAAGESSNAAEVRVRRRPVLVIDKPLDRDAFSRGKLDLKVIAKGSDKDDPIPKGALQLMSRDQVLAEGRTDREGIVALQRLYAMGATLAGNEPIAPGIYDLRLEFTPENKEQWATATEPLKGPWRVVPTAVLKVTLDEKDPKERRESLVRFKVEAGSAECKELPPRRRFFLRFRPSSRALTGAFETHFELNTDTGNPKLMVKWKPGKDSWGMAKPINNAPAFPVITLAIADTVEKAGKVPFDKAVKYTLNSAFPPPRGDDFGAYRPLVPAFRNVMRSLHGAEVEIYEGVDRKETFKDAKGKETEKTTRVMKDPNAPPLLRLKLLDQR